MSKVVVITGSTSGLGQATAESCLRMGARVLVSSENQEGLATTLGIFAPWKDSVTGLVCDVKDPRQLQSLKDCAIDRFGKIDCWINCAGTTAPSGDAALVPLSRGEMLINTNILGSYQGSIFALRCFREQGYGRLINITGRGEKSAVRGAALYGASKAWLRNFTRTLAKEEKGSEIEVGTFNPGLTLTALTAAPQILCGNEEAQLKGLRMIMPLIGDPASEPGRTLARIALQDKPIRIENQHRRLLPHVLKRLLTGRRADIDVSTIKARIVEPESEFPT